MQGAGGGGGRDPHVPNPRSARLPTADPVRGREFGGGISAGVQVAREDCGILQPLFLQWNITPGRRYGSSPFNFEVLGPQETVKHRTCYEMQ